MGKIEIAICEDRKEMRAAVRGHLKKYGILRNIEWEASEYETGEELCNAKDFQILLLDLDLPGIGGIEAAENLIASHSEKDLRIIILSGMETWFKETYRVHPVAFVSKPIREEELFRALDLAIRELDPGRTIRIRINGMEQEISEREIFYIKTSGDYCIFRTKRGKGERNITLTELRSLLTSDRFFLCKRTHLVNLEAVRRMTSDGVLLRTGEILPVARRKRKEFETAVSDFYFADWNGRN